MIVPVAVSSLTSVGQRRVQGIAQLHLERLSVSLVHHVVRRHHRHRLRRGPSRKRQRPARRRVVPRSLRPCRPPSRTTPSPASRSHPCSPRTTHVPPSITAVASPIDSTAGSSLSLIVPVVGQLAPRPADSVPSGASDRVHGIKALLSFTVNVSPSASSTVSFAVTTVTVFVVAPAANVSAPLVDV